MKAPTPYLVLPGTARAALTRYAEIFGGTLELHTYEEFGRTDGPPGAIAHGVLAGPVAMYASDAGKGEEPLRTEGLFFSILGAADPTTLHAWFEALAVGGRITDPLQERGWGASDGQVVDRFGLHWLIGWPSHQTRTHHSRTHHSRTHHSRTHHRFSSLPRPPRAAHDRLSIQIVRFAPEG